MVPVIDQFHGRKPTARVPKPARPAKPRLSKPPFFPHCCRSAILVTFRVITPLYLLVYCSYARTNAQLVERISFRPGD